MVFAPTMSDFMPRRGNGVYWPDVQKALFGRKTSQGRINKLIDAVAEDNFVLDEALHFLNEVGIHGHPKQHVANTIKYGIKPRVRKILRL